MKRILFIIFAFFTFTQVLAENVKVETLKVKIVEDNIDVSVNLSMYFPASVSEAIRNGIEAILTYKIELWERNGFLILFDKKITAVEIEKSVSYNMWDRKYSIKMGNTELKFNTEKEMLNDMIKVEDIKLCKKNTFEKKEYYYIRARAELESLKLFPPLSLLINLTSNWNFKTAWYDTDYFLGQVYNDR